MKFTRVPTVIYVLFLCYGLTNCQSAESETTRVKAFGREVNNILVEKIVRHFTGLTALEEKYKSLNIRTISRNTTQIVKDKVAILKKVLNDREDLVKRIAEEAEKLRNAGDPGTLTGGNISFYDTSKGTEIASEPEKLFYRNAKCGCPYQRPNDVPVENCTQPTNGYESNSHFGDYPVSYENTSVHIPTEVYNEDPDILKDIYLSHGIDNVIRNEVCTNRGFSNLTRWVYYTTRSGAMRFFPDRTWSNDCDTPDVYDSRISPWFLNSISSPKDVVILIDKSGSVKGLTLNLLHRSVKDFLSTLTTNDFVNVVLFNEEAHFINSKCSRLLQATPRNKQILRDWVYGIDTEKQAFYDKGFNLVLKELENTKRNDVYAAKCNPTVMFFTDGDSTYPSEQLEEYNADGDKRIFSFVVGKNFYGKTTTKEIACKNRGFYDSIPSYTATKPSVQQYLIKISEPLTSDTRNTVKWTLPYKDQFGLGFVLSVSTPVFEDGVNGRNVSGVVGTDILLEDLKKIIMESDMGYDYYPFVIDNNGFAVIHPNLIEMNHDDVITMDLMELEQSDLVSVRQNIIDGNTASERLSRNVILDKKYFLKSMYEYNYAPLEGTVFKFGLGAHVSKLEVLDVASTKASNYPDLTLQNLVSEQASDTTAILYSSPCVKRDMESFNPCEARNDTQGNTDDKARFLNGVPLSEFTADDTCETTSQLFSGLLLHGFLSDEAAKNTWEMNPQVQDGHGVLAMYTAIETPSFIRTKYLNFTKQTNAEMAKDDEMIKKEIQKILANPRDASYIRRAIHKPTWTIYSFAEPPDLTPTPTSSSGNETTTQTTEATTEAFTTQASAIVKRVTPGYIIASKAVLTVDGKNEIVSVVTGTVLDPATFQKNVFDLGYKCNDTSDCNKDSWDLMCNDAENTECLILDDGGFLLASNQEKHYDKISKFFGLVDGEFMRQLISQNAFLVTNVSDYQAVCEKDDNDKSAGIPRCFVPTIADFLSFGWWLSSCARVFFYSLFQNLLIGLWSLGELASSHVAMTTGSGLPTKREHCIMKKRILQYGANSVDSLFGEVDCTKTCKRPFTMVRMLNTNLVLIVASYNPACGKCTEVAPFDNEEINATIEQTCNNNTIRHRNPPDEQCFDASSFPKEKDSACSSAWSIHPTYTILLLFHLLHFLLCQLILR